MGAFSKGMENLGRLGLNEIIRKSIKQSKPFLGICLGMQLLFTETEEHGIHKGLDILPGKVRRLPSQVKIPHMGWNQIKIKNQKSKIGFFHSIPDESYFYFVHSYYVEPSDKNTISTTTNYGLEFASSIIQDNIFAVQFHPEKSSDIGLKILHNFAKDL